MGGVGYVNRNHDVTRQLCLYLEPLTVNRATKLQIWPDDGATSHREILSTSDGAHVVENLNLELM